MLSLRQFTEELEHVIDLVLLEELSDAQKKLVNNWASQNKPSAKVQSLHDKVFGEGNHRITIPLEKKPRDHTENPVHNEIVNHISGHGYSMADYDKGVVVDKHKRETTVGKALGKTKAPEGLMQKFNNDPSRQSAHSLDSGKSITISRHPIDVGSMSTGRDWDKTSCMRIGTNGSIKDDTGCNRKYIKSDFEHGTLAAYVHDNDDTNLKKPQSRVLLKRHDADDRANPSIFRPEKRIYGHQSEDIHHTLNKWAEKNYPDKDDEVYEKHHSLYNDDGNTIKTKIKSFSPKLLDAHVRHAENSYDRAVNNDSGWGVGGSKQDKINDALYRYRNTLSEPDKRLMHKHLNVKLASDYHANEGMRYKEHWSEENPNDNDNAHEHRFTIANAKIHPEHVDDIAKAFVDGHEKSHGNHTTAEHNWNELEEAIANHGNDKSKSYLLSHHATFGHDSHEDTLFDPRDHIIGKHTARAFLDAHDRETEHYGVHHSDKLPSGAYSSIAEHGDDDTFHRLLHSTNIHHNYNSYMKMAGDASTKRQHKMIDDLQFDNSEHNGDSKEKLRGLTSSTSKQILHRLKNHPELSDMDREQIHKKLNGDKDNPYSITDHLTESKK